MDRVCMTENVSSSKFDRNGLRSAPPSGSRRTLWFINSGTKSNQKDWEGAGCALPAPPSCFWCPWQEDRTVIEPTEEQVVRRARDLTGSRRLRILEKTGGIPDPGIACDEVVWLTGEFLEVSGGYR